MDYGAFKLKKKKAIIWQVSKRLNERTLEEHSCWLNTARVKNHRDFYKSGCRKYISYHLLFVQVKKNLEIRSMNLRK